MSRRHDDGGAWIALAAILGLGAILATAIAAEGGGPLPATPISTALDWQPVLGLREPWRLWTAAWVHLGGAHLAVNLAGLAVLAFVGWRARAGAALAAAWGLAWPLTQALMLAVGGGLAAVMPHYGGLSGVLHAGAIVLGLALAWPRTCVAARAQGVVLVHTGFAATRASAIEPSRITEGPWAMTSLEESPLHTAAPDSMLEAATSPVAAAQAMRDRWIGAAIVAGTLAKVVLETPWMLAPRPSADLGIAVAPIAHACGVAAGALAWLAMRAARGRAADVRA
jgi:hypothetical protein